MKCSKCGFEDEGKFCSECGAKLPNEKAPEESYEPKTKAVRLPYNFDMHTMDNLEKTGKSAFMMSAFLMRKYGYNNAQSEEIVAAYLALKPFRKKASKEERHKALVELGILKPRKPLETFDKPNMINGVPVCPKCGSTKVYVEKLANADYRKNQQKGFAFWGAIVYHNTTSCITCTECGHFWNV